MILRRIAEGIRNQDWFVVTVEIMIVVVGIFIGLQVDDWNEARKDRVLERQYLERLYSDILGTIEDNRGVEIWNTERVESGIFILEVLAQGNLNEQDRARFDIGLLNLGHLNPVRRRWATVEELKATGNLAILQNVELRDLIGRTESAFERSDKIVLKQENNVAHIRPIIAARFDVIHPERSVRYDFVALSVDTEFKRAVSHITDYSRIMVNMHANHMRAVEDLRAKIATILTVDAAAGTEAADGEPEPTAQ